MALTCTVNVMCRARVLTEEELCQEGGDKLSSQCLPDERSISMSCDMRKHDFVFDHVFSSSASQERVFEVVGEPILEDVLRGYNGTIFAYGQTAAGKTYSMMGPSDENFEGYSDDTSKLGIIPRLVGSLFERIQKASRNTQFILKVSYFEIYMERVRDLLDQRKQNCQIREDKKTGKGVYVSDITEVYIGSPEEVLTVIKNGAKNRALASTKMNRSSSRSHCIFQLTVTQRNLVTDEVRTGKLFLVDLAGSEKVQKTEAEGMRLEEARKINLSLTHLGMVISALTDGKSSHIPYRDSKLTRLLQDSLGGNSRTTLLINISPSILHSSETLSTLFFGKRAKKIRNRPKRNIELGVKELQIELSRAKAEVKRLLERGDVEDIRKENSVLQKENRKLKVKVDELVDDNKVMEETIITNEMLKAQVRVLNFILKNQGFASEEIEEAVHEGTLLEQDTEEGLDRASSASSLLLSSPIPRRPNLSSDNLSEVILSAIDAETQTTINDEYNNLDVVRTGKTSNISFGESVESVNSLFDEGTQTMEIDENVESVNSLFDEGTQTIEIGESVESVNSLFDEGTQTMDIDENVESVNSLFDEGTQTMEIEENDSAREWDDSVVRRMKTELSEIRTRYNDLKNEFEKHFSFFETTVQSSFLQVSEEVGAAEKSFKSHLEDIRQTLSELENKPVMDEGKSRDDDESVDAEDLAMYIMKDQLTSLLRDRENAHWKITSLRSRVDELMSEDNIGSQDSQVVKLVTGGQFEEIRRESMASSEVDSQSDVTLMSSSETAEKSVSLKEDESRARTHSVIEKGSYLYTMLRRRGTVFGSLKGLFQKRSKVWGVLSGNEFKIYNKIGDTIPENVIVLTKDSCAELVEQSGSPSSKFFSFRISNPQMPSIVFSARSREQAADWVRMVNRIARKLLAEHVEEEMSHESEVRDEV